MSTGSHRTGAIARRVAGALVALAALATLAACGGSQMVHRSALVPAITPPMMDGQPIDNGVAQLGFGNSTYLRAAEPVALAGQATRAGLYVPRTQFGLQALFRLGPTALGPKLEIGLEQGAQPIAEQMLDRPNGPTVGFGPAFEASIPVSGGFRLGLGLETLIFGAPYRKHISSEGTGTDETGTDLVLVLGLSVIPSYRIGPVTIFGGISGRNQPTTLKDEWQSSPDVWDDEVTFGTMYGVAFAGANLRLFKRLDLTAQLYYPWTDDPVQYGGPALALWIRLTAGSPPRPRRPRPYHYPPQYYQQAPPPPPQPAPAPAPPPQPRPEVAPPPPPEDAPPPQQQPDPDIVEIQ